MPATIFAGTKVKALKSELQLNSSGASIISSTVDPTSSAVDAVRGTLLMNITSGTTYRKLDNGSSTNWSVVSASVLDSSYRMENLAVAASVSGNALTVALKTKAGSDASAGDPVSIGFRSATITSGVYLVRTVASALSVVVSSGSTLGHQSGVSRFIYVYAIDNAGTVELAVSSSVYKDDSLVSTTAEGGAGGADSNTAIYSTTARTGVALRMIAKLTIQQTTAGTWTATPTKIYLTEPGFAFSEVVSARYSTAAGQSIANGATAIVDYDTKTHDSHGAVTTGGSWAFVATMDSKYRITAKQRYANGLAWTQGGSVYFQIYKNGSGYSLPAESVISTSFTSGTGFSAAGSDTIELVIGDSINVRASHQEASARALLAAGTHNFIDIESV